MSERQHHWAVAIVCDLDDPGAFAALGEIERLDAAAALVSGGPDRLPRVQAVRGPQCRDCRVSFDDVEAIRQSGKEWPCLGRRPDALGGPLLAPEPVGKSRQQRRAEHRASVEAVRDDDRRRALARIAVDNAARLAKSTAEA